MTQKPQIPAIDCPLSGAYLIEASAGTGKTWTLTGIILRILIEKKIRPEQIIATTFTRAAAKEIKERVHERLQDFFEVCQWIERHFDELYQLDDDDFVKKMQANKDTLMALDDPINQHLAAYIRSPDGFGQAKQYTQLLLTSVDKLFVGTLDSLAQKWLREFSHEIGDTGSLELLSDVSDVMATLVHDEVRKLGSQFYHDHPIAYQLLKDTFDNPSKMYNQAKNAWHFFTAPIDAIQPLVGNEFDGLQAWLDEFLAQDFSPLLRFFDKDYRLASGFSGTSIVTKRLDDMAKWLEQFQTLGVMAFDNFDKDNIGLLEKFTQNELQKIPKKSTPSDKIDEWQAVCEQFLLPLKEKYDYFGSLKAQYQSQILAQIGNNVRHTLKKTLSDDKKTSFTLQMVQLTDALSGRQGQILANHIRHQYPVALIDEVQDVSGEQAWLIEKVYAKKYIEIANRTNKDQAQEPQAPKGRGFLLLVGDPKQAIYRFRGGDVANYNFLKNLGLNTNFTLTVNRRSHDGLIVGLNHWFMMDNQGVSLGEGITYPKIEFDKTHKNAPWLNHHSDDTTKALMGDKPIALLSADSVDEEQAVAWHINSLLHAKASFVDKAGSKRLISPSDIAVLVRNTKGIKTIHRLLESLDISVKVAKLESIFETVACRHLYGLLLTVLDSRREHLGELLTGLFGYSFKQAQSVLDDDKQSSQLYQYLKNVQKQWLHGGIAKALNSAFETCEFKNGVFCLIKPNQTSQANLWTHLASHGDGERYLTDIWQLFEILSVWQESPMHLLDKLASFQLNPPNDEAYERISLPSESGVALMTIHGSKGLEFPIVYVVGANRMPKKDKGILYPYVANDQRRLSATAGNASDDEFFLSKNHQESLDESKRLAYVALTRASEQLIVVVKDNTKRAVNGTIFGEWGLLKDGKTYQLPERLQAYASLLMFDELPIIKDKLPPQADDYAMIDYPAWQEVFKTTYFKAVGGTSFTRLAQYLGENTAYQELLQNHSIDGHHLTDDQLPSHELTLDSDRMMGELTTMDIADTDQYIDDDWIIPTHDIRTSFAKGKVAGVFLHHILEQMARLDNYRLSDELANWLNNQFITNQEIANQEITKQAIVNQELIHKDPLCSLIKKSARQSNLTFDDNQLIELASWLEQIATTPFRASGVPLCDIGYKQSELNFCLGVDIQTQWQELPQIFAKYQCYLPDLPSFDEYFGFINGQIDLVYEYQGKYYVVDYKSNFLGNHGDDYDDVNMQKSMIEHSYYLQAVIYQLVLHRLLSTRLENYQPDTHLGAVEYVFLRGISNMDKQEQGRFIWQIPSDLVVELDEFFGKSN